VYRRLAAVERVGDTQPVRSPDGRYVAVADCEIYHQRDLVEELTAAGYQLATHSDVEIMLAAWRHWGTAGLARCDGVFALAILDTVTGEVVLARDAFGVRPLYLAADGSGRVAFGSEPLPILAASVVPRRPDDVTLHRYLRYGAHDDTERTFFDRITRLLPGQLAVVTPDGQVRRGRHTRLRRELAWLAADPRRYGRAAAVGFRAALADSVRRRLGGDAPVGTVLSGGLAPASVVATVDRLLARADPTTAPVGTVQRAFSSGRPAGTPREARRFGAIRQFWADRRYGADQRYEAAVAAGCGDRLTIHRAQPDSGRSRADLVDFIRTQQEPVASLEPYDGYRLARVAGAQVTVLLSAVGAAELLAGGHPYLLVRLRELRREHRFLALAALLVRNARAVWGLVWARARRRPDRGGRLLAAGFAAAHADQPPPAVVGDDLKGRLTDDLFVNRLPALLRYQDRNVARFSVVGRAPFLDPQLVKLLWRLESTAIAGRGKDQRLLREATERLLPRFARRHGRAWRTPPHPVWPDELRAYAQEVFTSGSFAARPYFEPAAVAEAFRGHRGGDADRVFWRLLNVELWLRELIDRDPTVVPVTASTAAAPAVPGPVAPFPPAKHDWQPNRDKQLVTADGRWVRFPLQVPMVRSGDDVARLAAGRTARFYARLDEAPAEAAALVGTERWYVFMCEKAAAVAQGRRVNPDWRIHPPWWARRLSQLVGSDAVDQTGAGGTGAASPRDPTDLPRKLAASSASADGKPAGNADGRSAGNAVGRPAGKAGGRPAGRGPNAATRNDPASTNGSRLGLEDPGRVARNISGAVRRRLPEPVVARFGGTAIIAADETGRTVLGHDTDLAIADLLTAFADNPLGQGREQTPLAVVVARH
jgi:asparagine synthase (glutamine-hydrolysing)